ncbi:hypothetical protein AMTR_s00046p00232890 [Amborella trichopoda]|uniref:PB1 domain-containing protein n=2 Tax=Amborella trichopoda TaxID=13333 RepID=U5D9K6_AMBTC|nr:hypothetical protein AMTR_s00046p00232890 [Amborella trichopoda]
MEYYSSCPDSTNSSPRSREIDCENQGWEEPASYKVKFMCSYGGKIHPRPHDNQLTYVGGDTKILAIDRNIKFAAMMAKLATLWDTEVSFKYQLPGEDLDALISVTNDEDLEHMMAEYDRLYRSSNRPARLRLFLFPAISPATTAGMAAGDQQPEQQWFVDALNSGRVQPSKLESSPGNPDFLFGLEKSSANLSSATNESPLSNQSSIETRESFAESRKDENQNQSQIPEQLVLQNPNPNQVDIQRQILEFQRFQLQEQQQQQQQQQSAIYQRRQQEETLASAGNFPARIPAASADFYMQKPPEKARYEQVPAGPPMTGYWPVPERHLAAANETPVYLVPSGFSAGSRPVPTQTGQLGQGYYTMPRVMATTGGYVTEPYREPYKDTVVYGSGPKGVVYGEGAGRASTDAATVYHQQVAYDSTGRAVYYTAPAPAPAPAPSPAPAVPTYTNLTSGPSVEVPKVAKTSPQSPS